MSERNLYEEPPELDEDLSPPITMLGLRESTEADLTKLFRTRLNWELIRKLEEHEDRVPTDHEVETFCEMRQTPDHVQHYYWKNKWLFSIAVQLNNKDNMARVWFNDTDAPQLKQQEDE